MRPLVIDDAARSEAARVIGHAEAHHYYPGKMGTPGDDPAFVAKFGTYRSVFTFTHSDGAVWRHLSISVPSKKFPNPYAAYMIAELFGFTGWNGKTVEPPEGWLMNVNDREHCITLVQPIASERGH